MGKFLSIAHNTFVQSLRQPITCVLVLSTFFVLVLSVPTSTWTMGESGGDFSETNQKMLENLGLSTLLIILGLPMAAFSASGALAREIEDKTALTVISKPVSRPLFVLGKFAGVAAAVALTYYLGTLVLLLTVRHRVISAASEPYDWPVIVIGCTGFCLALLAATGGNFFFSWPFTSAFIWSAVACLSLAMGVVLFVGKDWRLVSPGYDSPPQTYDVIRARLQEMKFKEPFAARAGRQKYILLRWDFNQPVAYLQPPEKTSVPEGIAEIGRWGAEGVASVGRQTDPPVLRPELLAGIGLNFLSLLVLVAVAIAASTRLGLVLTLLVCVGAFLMGALHPYLGHRGGGNLTVLLLGWLTPNLTYFYSMDVLSRPFETAIPLGFLSASALYCALYVAGVLAVGIALFQRREMAAEGGGASVPGAVNLLAGLGRAAALVLGLAGLILLSVPAMHTAWGLLIVGLVLLAGVVNWFLWGYFAHRAKWAYWLVLVSAMLDLIRYAVPALWPQARPYVLAGREGAVPGALLALAAGATLLILLLPKTRRHFHTRSR